MSRASSSSSRSHSSSRRSPSYSSDSRSRSYSSSSSTSFSSNSVDSPVQKPRRNRRRLSDASSSAGSNRSLVAPIPKGDQSQTENNNNGSLAEDSKLFHITDPSVTPTDNDRTDQSFAITPDTLDPEKPLSTLLLQNMLRTGLALDLIEKKRQRKEGALVVRDGNENYDLVFTEEKRNPGGVPLVASRVTDRMFALRGLSIERRHAALVRQRLQRLYSELAVLDAVPVSNFKPTSEHSRAMPTEKPTFVPIVPAAAKGSSVNRVRPMSATASFGAGKDYKPKFDVSEQRLRPAKVSAKALLEGPTPPSRSSSRSSHCQSPRSTTAGTKRPLSSSANTNVLPPSSGASSSVRRKNTRKEKASDDSSREAMNELSSSGLYDQRSSAASAASVYSQSSGSNRGGRRYNFSSSADQAPSAAVSKGRK